MSSRTPPAFPASACPLPLSGRGGGRRCLRAFLWLVAVAVLVPAGLVPGVQADAQADAQAEPEEARGGALPGSRKQFTAIQKAWEGRNAAGVVGMVASRGWLHLSLLMPKVAAGRYQRAQAQKTLQAYFQQVSSVKLKDVTPPRLPQPYGYNVRQYDYTYAPRGRDRVTTRLVIRLKLQGRSEWKLVSIVETPRPPSGPR